MRRDGISWLEDYAAGVKRGREEKRLIVVHFWMADRPLSGAMLKETFAHQDVVRISRRDFVNVKLDGAAHPDLFRRIVGSRGGMGTGILDASEDVVSALPGFVDSAKYVAFLGRAHRGAAALAKARGSAKRRPKSAAVRFALAEEYSELGSRARAEATFREVLELGKESSSPVVRRAVAYSHERLARLAAMKGRNRDARTHLAEYRNRLALGGVRREDRVLVTEALACSIERRFPEALAVLGRAQARFPTSPEADQIALLTGLCLHESGKDAEARQALEAMIRSFPHSPWVPDARARIEHIKNPPPGHTHPE